MAGEGRARRVRGASSSAEPPAEEATVVTHVNVHIAEGPREEAGLHGYPSLAFAPRFAIPKKSGPLIDLAPVTAIAIAVRELHSFPSKRNPVSSTWTARQAALGRGERRGRRAGRSLAGAGDVG